MACCAFAIFLVMHLLRPFRALARKLGLAKEWQPDLAVEWRPGGAAPQKKRERARRAALVVAAGGLVAAPAFASQGSPAATAASVEAAIHASICGPLGWRD